MKKLIVALSLSFVCSTAWCFDPYKDLGDAKVMSMGECFANIGESLPCFIVEKQGKFYIVMVSDVEILAVYQVPSFKENYDKKEMKLIWEKKQKPSGSRV